jgi:hypothetical protein
VRAPTADAFPTTVAKIAEEGREEECGQKPTALNAEVVPEFLHAS